MYSNTVSLSLKVPPERVYAYLADLARHAEWSSNVREIKLISGQAGTVGAQYEAQEDVPRNLTSYATLTGLQPPTRIAWQATDHRVFRTEWEFHITPEPQGSRLEQSVKFFPLNPFAYVILYLFRVPRVAAEDRASLERIRARLES